MAAEVVFIKYATLPAEIYLLEELFNRRLFASCFKAFEMQHKIVRRVIIVFAAYLACQYLIAAFFQLFIYFECNFKAFEMQRKIVRRIHDRWLHCAHVLLCARLWTVKCSSQAIACNRRI